MIVYASLVEITNAVSEIDIYLSERDIYLLTFTLQVTMENTIFTSDDIENFKKFYKNFEYANSVYKELRDHINEYVAISNSRILGYSKDKQVLLKDFGRSSDIFIDLITDENIKWIL